MLDLFGESAGTREFARGWRKGVFRLRHGISGRNNLLFTVRNPVVERLTDGDPGLRQGSVANDGDQQAGQNTRSVFHDSSLKN